MRLSALALLAGFVTPAFAGEALPAKGVFVGPSYAFTFTAPPGLTYCRLGDDWMGLDHGTVLFIVPPRSCGGAGYPSAARGFEPSDVPRIQVYYGHWLEDLPQPSCHAVGHMPFLGRVQKLCSNHRDGMVVREVRGLYTADDQTEAILTLLTTPSRLEQDLVVLRTLAASAHPCAIPWQDAQRHTLIEGSGRPCKKHGDGYGDFY